MAFLCWDSHKADIDDIAEMLIATYFLSHMPNQEKLMIEVTGVPMSYTDRPLRDSVRFTPANALHRHVHASTYRSSQHGLGP